MKKISLQFNLLLLSVLLLFSVTMNAQGQEAKIDFYS